MLGKYSNVRVKGIVSKEWEEERIHNSECKVSDSCIKISDVLLNNMEWNKEDVRILILVTQSPDFIFPSTSFYIQKELGIGKYCTVFDINMGANGYPLGLQMVAGLLQPYGEGAKGLLLSGNIKRGRNRKTYGQAAVTALELREGNEFYYSQKSYGEYNKEVLQRTVEEGYFRNETFWKEFILQKGDECRNEMLEGFGLSNQGFAYVGFSQPDKDLIGEEFFDSPASLPIHIGKWMDVANGKNRENYVLVNGIGAGIGAASAFFLKPKISICM